MNLIKRDVPGSSSTKNSFKGKNDMHGSSTNVAFESIESSILVHVKLKFMIISSLHSYNILVLLFFGYI